MSRTKEREISFTVRLPESLNKQIEDRCRFSRRSKNQEVILLLENAIDKSVEDTLKAMPKQPGG